MDEEEQDEGEIQIEEKVEPHRVPVWYAPLRK